MGWLTRVLHWTVPAITLAFASSHGLPPSLGLYAASAPPVEFTFVKGDTREGSSIRVRIQGDSLHYRQTIYAPGEDPVVSNTSVVLTAQRRRAFKRLLGDIPRYKTFGSCFGKGMRYYMVETPAGKFYRSLPEKSGRCYADEPGIFSLFDDMDELFTPPENPPTPGVSSVASGSPAS